MGLVGICSGSRPWTNQPATVRSTARWHAGGPYFQFGCSHSPFSRQTAAECFYHERQEGKETEKERETDESWSKETKRRGSSVTAVATANTKRGQEREERTEKKTARRRGEKGQYEPV